MIINCLKVITLTLSVVVSTGLEAKPIPDWPVVGQAKLEVLWFDIYHAELSSPSGSYDQAKPIKLTLTYLRDFDSSELVKETFNQLTIIPTEAQTNAWKLQLSQLWPDVKAGDQISFVKDDNGVSHFYFNQNYQGQIQDVEFGDSFAAIWLSDESSYPKLAARLKGERR